MGEIGNALKMLTVLSSRGKLKSDELADILDVSRRQIQRYRLDLEEAGIQVNSVRGRYGGYSVEKGQFINFIKVEDYEINLMRMTMDKLESDNWPYAREFGVIFDKLKALTVHNDIENYNNPFMFLEQPTNYTMQKVKDNIMDLQTAIIAKNKVSIQYKSALKELSERTIHPIKIVYYKNHAYVSAFCEDKNEMRDFKINRIVDLDILSAQFRNHDEIDFENYFDKCFGIFKDDNIELKLKIRPPFSTIVSEKIWSKDQKIIDLQDGSVYFEATMNGKIEIINWILSMREYCTILEPESFRDEVKEIINKMSENF